MRLPSGPKQRLSSDRPRLPAASRRRGFSLVEATVGIFIMAICASIMYVTLPMSSKTGKMVGNANQASSLVQHKIDQLRGVGYGRLTFKELSNAGIIDATPATSPYSFVGVDGLAAIYNNPVATINITQFNSEISQVTVQLSWSGNGNQPSSGSLVASALIAKG